MTLNRVSFCGPIWTTRPVTKPRQNNSSDRINLRDYFTKDEINKMIHRFPSVTSNFDEYTRNPDNVDVYFIPKADHVVLNNRAMTNHTVEIYKDGHAISVGSWHCKEYEDNFIDVINDVKARVNKTK